MKKRKPVKAYKPPKSMRKAINDKCRDCIYDDCVTGTWRAQVEACTIEDCPLWNVRPRTTATAAANAKPRGTRKAAGVQAGESHGDAA